MSDLNLTKIRMSNGVWQGRISGAKPAGPAPDIVVRHLDQPVPGVDVRAGGNPGTWDISVPVPGHAIADGVQTFVILDGADDTRLGDFTLIAGEAATDDLRAEVELLRAELDMLKRAFRRHCVETAGS